MHLFRLRAVDLNFLCKVTARETQACERPRAAINDGVNPKIKKWETADSFVLSDNEAVKVIKLTNYTWVTWNNL